MDAPLTVGLTSQVFTVSGVEIRVPADVDEAAFGIKDPVRGAGVLGEKAPKRSGVIAPRIRALHVPLIQRVGQRMNGYWMFQCCTPLIMMIGARVLRLSDRSLFDFNILRFQHCSISTRE